jgi:hypothetical protein
MRITVTGRGTRRVFVPLQLGLSPRSPLLQTRESPTGLRRSLSASSCLVKTVILPDGEALNL